ncbi:MAG: hypothetical protein R3E62_10005 [Pseudomonadales bacterium]
MKKTVALMAKIAAILAVPSFAWAETVTGNVEAVSFCEWKQDFVANLIKVDGYWYRGEESSTGASSVRLTLHQWWLSAPMAALTSGKTITMTYKPVTENRCGKAVVGQFDYAGSYAEIQINQ